MQPILRPKMPELDSLRGVACLMVLFFHGFANHYSTLHLPLLPRLFVISSSVGWTGVNLFFVLSGFLITGILLDSKSRPDYFRRFYLRRALRILPAYYAVLAVVLLLWKSGLIDREMSWGFLGLSAIYLSNLTPLLGVPIQYGVLWSLAVEEHFYLLWPMFVRLRGLLGISILAGFVCLGSLAARILSSLTQHNPLDYYTWLVADGLAMGALLAIAVRYFQQRRSVMWRIAGGAFLAAACCFLIDRPFGHAVFGGSLHITGFNLFYAATLVVALLLGSRFVIRQPVLEFIGEISYGLYLIHILAFDVFDHFAPRVWPALAHGAGHFSIMAFRFVIVASVAIAVSYLSRHYYEEPFLRLKDRFDATPPSLAIEPEGPMPEPSQEFAS